MLTAGSDGTGRFARVPFKSPLSGVSDVAWDAFALALSVRGVSATAASGGVGSFELRPRRLGELGILTNMHRDERGKWVGDYVLPDTEALIRCRPARQLEIFSLSMVAYDADLTSGLLARPDGASRSGCLAILHCGGTGALERWPEGAFKTTRAIFDRVNGLF